MFAKNTFVPCALRQKDLYHQKHWRPCPYHPSGHQL